MACKNNKLNSSINKIKKKYFVLNEKAAEKTWPFVFIRVKVYLAHFQKDFGWKKITTKRPMFKYLGCDIHWQTPGSSVCHSPSWKKQSRDLKEEWHVPWNAQFSGFCHYVTHCISFKICFYTLYKPFMDPGHMTSSLGNKKQNKKKDSGEILIVSLHQSY